MFRIILLAAVVLMAGFYISVNDNPNDDLLKVQHKTEKQPNLPHVPQNKASKTAAEMPAEGLALLIGQNVAELEKEYGQPQRIDQSFYGYQWYIYNLDGSHYFQAGVENNRVVTIFTIGDALDVVPFEIGQPIEEIFNTLYVNSTVSLDLNGSSYRFELSESDLNTRPLVQLGNIYAQLYVDKFTGNLSAVRFMDAATLVKQRPYSLVYRGTLIEPPVLTNDLWKTVEDGTEKEIFDLTNVLRARNDVEPLSWDSKTAKAAYKHSKDMSQHHYFSHTSKKYGTLNDRLKAEKVSYQKAGENIAADYTDGPSAVARWLNSKTPRKTLLNKDFTGLGVGVYQKYYTQDFVKK